MRNILVPKLFRFAEIFRFNIFKSSRCSEWGNACNLCYAKPSTNYDVAYEVTCFALWRWINIFLSISPDDYRSCRLIQVFCHKYSVVFFYTIVIRLEAWLTNWLTVNLLKRKKEKENLLFLVNTKYISSRELKTSKFLFVPCTHDNTDVFNTLDEIYLVFT